VFTVSHGTRKDKRGPVRSVSVLITGIISPQCLIYHTSVHYPVIDRGGQDLARHILIRTVPRSNSETDRACWISKDFSCLLKTQPWVGCGPRPHCCTQPADSVLILLTTDSLSASYNNNDNNNNNKLVDNKSKESQGDKLIRCSNNTRIETAACT
jgi:hypothetical protein